MCLQAQSCALQPQKLVATNEAPYCRLHNDNVFSPQIHSKLLQIRNLTSAEEYLSVPEAIFVVILKPVTHNVRASRFHIPINDFGSFT
jgi:hypothetical protein